MKKILFAIACTAALHTVTPAFAISPDGGSSAPAATNSITGDEDPGQERGGCSATGFAGARNASALTVLLGSIATLAVLRRRSRT